LCVARACAYELQTARASEGNDNTATASNIVAPAGFRAHCQRFEGTILRNQNLSDGCNCRLKSQARHRLSSVSESQHLNLPWPGVTRKCYVQAWPQGSMRLDYASSTSHSP
jgi:hypothetical protein